MAFSTSDGALAVLSGAPGLSGAAVFVDYENLFYFLRTHYFEPPDGHELVQELLRRLRHHLAQPPASGAGTAVRQVLASAYGDFERLPSGALSALYLQGIEPHHVAGSDHKNAADMRLCVDAVATHYTRPDIGTFVFAAGDRDYIPVLQHLRRQGRQVRVVAFAANLSGDLRANLDADQLVDAFALFDTATQHRLRERRTTGLERRRLSDLLRTQGLPAAGHLLPATADADPTGVGAEAVAPAAETDAPLTTAAPDAVASAVPAPGAGEALTETATEPTEAATPEPPAAAFALDPLARPRSTSQIVVRPGPAFGGVPVRPPGAGSATPLDRNWIAPGTGASPIFGEVETEFAKSARVRNESTRAVLDAMVHYAPRFPEKFMVPLSRHLREALPALAEFERKRQINDLVGAGAVRLARRIDAQGNVMTVVVMNLNHPDVRELHPGM